ncbi:Uncharacterised protein [Vibrio cholerae]|uniref:Uncharacterized protein n=1 Tax=Vibrio cholerae TaxID=666 RepID=A0A655XLT8_VIBCL|nr:Uncharacterised protein [Vibrio cholerae]CSA13048.1 Uncharacterised protein [Vibrio cholerae]CSA29157.1 Uncharacterised protein [Vibrio cholerae]CSA45160.1 Uncharacterised protein [Vibrio cholerae]CSA45649.1 Uncharacterised protein [Vibrio cholerae]
MLMSAQQKVGVDRRFPHCVATVAQCVVRDPPRTIGAVPKIAAIVTTQSPYRAHHHQVSSPSRDESPTDRAGAHRADPQTLPAMRDKHTRMPSH